MDRQWLEQEITVCTECLMASCWQAIFMCQKARHAGITKKTRIELIQLGLEHTDYMKTDEEMADRNLLESAKTPISSEEG